MRRLLVAILTIMTAVGVATARRGVHHASTKLQESDLLDRKGDSLSIDNSLSREDSIQLLIGVDSIYYQYIDKTRPFYDSLKSSSRKSDVTRLMYSILVVNPGNRAINAAEKQFEDEVNELKRFEGKLIGNISIERENVFGRRTSKLEAAANSVHHLTRLSTVRRDLLFKSGDKFNPELIVKNNQLIRSRSHISRSEIIMSPNEYDTMLVDVKVYVRDSWTISVDGGLIEKDRGMLELYDANFLGYGNRLSVKTYAGWMDNKGYGGNALRYRIPNLMGTFYNADMEVGKTFEKQLVKASMERRFFLDSDYEIGVNYEFRDDTRFAIREVDTVKHKHVRYQTADFWGGRSLRLKNRKSSIYLTWHYGIGHFHKTPGVSEYLNPSLHNYQRALFGLGLYREKFFTTNMVYGYGRKEYLASGHKIELVSGYSWEQFRNGYYVGIEGMLGNFTKLGYFMLDLKAGGLIERGSKQLWRETLDVTLHWFSMINKSSLVRIRQFVTVNYTQGWNHGEGYNSLLSYTRSDGLTSYKKYSTGTNRAIINTETVMFTSLQPLGFRLAFFLFADAGTIGFSNQFWRNDFCSTFGIGIRLKNEYLIFNALQIRLGFALGKNGFVDNSMLAISGQPRIAPYRFLPSKPDFIPFY